jgi:hypothetical protein
VRLLALLVFALLLGATAPIGATPTATPTETPTTNTTTAVISPGVASPTPTDGREFTPVPKPPTATPTATATPGATRPSGRAVGKNIELSPATSISRYWFVEDRFVVELRSEMATDVTIVESIGERGDGAHRLNKRSVPVSPGRSLVTLHAPPVGGSSSATITTRQSEYVIGLRSTSGQSLISAPYASNALGASALAGVLMTCLLAVAITIRRNKSKGGRLL